MSSKAPSVARSLAALSLAASSVIVACGSTRLENAFDPAANASAGGVGAASESAGDGGDGNVPPISQEPIVVLSDFPVSYTVGPVNAERINVTGLPFTQAWRATMKGQPTVSWTAQLIVPQSKPVAKGQLLHVSFWVKCETAGANGDCDTTFIFERASDPWEKSVAFATKTSSTWTQKSEFFSTVDSYQPGVAHMVFRLGFAAQVIDIGGVEVEAIGSPP